MGRDDTREKLWTPAFVLLTLVQTMDLLVFHTITPVIAKFTIQQGVALTASGLAASRPSAQRSGSPRHARPAH